MDKYLAFPSWFLDMFFNALIKRQGSFLSCGHNHFSALCHIYRAQISPWLSVYAPREVLCLCILGSLQMASVQAARSHSHHSSAKTFPSQCSNVARIWLSLCICGGQRVLSHCCFCWESIWLPALESYRPCKAAKCVFSSSFVCGMTSAAIQSTVMRAGPGLDPRVGAFKPGQVPPEITGQDRRKWNGKSDYQQRAKPPPRLLLTPISVSHKPNKNLPRLVLPSLSSLSRGSQQYQTFSWEFSKLNWFFLFVKWGSISPSDTCTANAPKQEMLPCLWLFRAELLSHHHWPFTDEIQYA